MSLDLTFDEFEARRELAREIGGLFLAREFPGKPGAAPLGLCVDALGFALGSLALASGLPIDSVLTRAVAVARRFVDAAKAPEGGAPDAAN